MIRFLLLMNRQGVTRLGKFYVPYDDDEKEKIKQDVHRLVCSRSSAYTNFLEYKVHRLVYRRYAGLYFITCVDVGDNELAQLESIHLFVELLDRYFGNVCELDLIFNFHKTYQLLDEYYLAGEVHETSKAVILQRMREMEALP